MKSAERSAAATGNPPNRSPKVFRDRAQAIDAAGHRKSPHRAIPSVALRRIRASSRIASAVPKGRGANNESKSCSSINLLRQLCMHRTKSHFTGKRVCRDLCSHSHAKWSFVVGPDTLKHLNDGTSYRENAFQEAGGGVYGYSIGWRTGEET